MNEEYNLVMKEGVEVIATITSCQFSPDPDDFEHEIVHFDFEYSIDSKVMKKSHSFSINTMHIIYAHDGQLLDIPRLKYSLEDFKAAIAPGKTIKVRSLPKEPYWIVIEYNEVLNVVMNIEAVWM